MADLKRGYTAHSEEAALFELDLFDEKWGSAYPKITVSRRNNWANLATYFKYPQEVRTLIYTVFCKRKAFTNQTEYHSTAKWTQSRRDWGKIHSQLEIYFVDRLD